MYLSKIIMIAIGVIIITTMIMIILTPPSAVGLSATKALLMAKYCCPQIPTMLEEQ